MFRYHVVNRLSKFPNPSINVSKIIFAEISREHLSGSITGLNFIKLVRYWMNCLCISFSFRMSLKSRNLRKRGISNVADALGADTRSISTESNASKGGKVKQEETFSILNGKPDPQMKSLVRSPLENPQGRWSQRVVNYSNALVMQIASNPSQWFYNITVLYLLQLQELGTPFPITRSTIVYVG